VKVIVRSGFDEMKASPWEKEDAMHEGIPILNYHVPKAFVHENGKLTGMTFEKVRAEYDDKGRRKLVPTGEPDVFVPCDDVLIAVGQENAFPWIERDIGIEFDEWGMPVVDKVTVPVDGAERVLRRRRRVRAQEHHLGGRARPRGRGVDRQVPARRRRAASAPRRHVNLMSQKMGIHEWSYDNDISATSASRCRGPRLEKALTSIKVEVELGFDPRPPGRSRSAASTATCRRCSPKAVHRVRRLRRHLPDGLHHLHRNGGREADLRKRLTAPALNLTQDLYVSDR
jgi:formate dehydrogenase beta subunit